MFNNLFKRAQTGMTMVETTISLGILMVGVLASLTLMMSSFNYVRQSEHEIIIVNLAREGVEIMRSIRNNERQENQDDVDFFDGSYTADQGTNKFIVDSQTSNDSSQFENQNILSNSAAINSAAECSDCQLYLSPIGRYTHTVYGNTPTIYRRLITLLPGSDANEKIIISEVSWQVENRTYSYAIEAHLTNWQ